MKYIQGQNREQIQLFPVSLDSMISSEHEVRLIDAFVDSLKLENYGFVLNHGDNGRPAYHPTDLLKLYMYGYLNRIRSSRELEKECSRNIELMWLMKMLKPDHNTISNFRKNNENGIKKVFRQTVKIARDFNLIGGVLIAGDSTKLRAQNSKKNNFNEKKIERHLAYIEKKLKEYNELLAEADGDKKKEIATNIDKHNDRKEKYINLKKELKETGQVQISTSDPDSRQMVLRNHVTEVAYNVQATVDAKKKLFIDFKVTSTNDSKAMGNMLQRAKTILETNKFTALYDKGYHTGCELAVADRLGIEAMVAIPATPKTSQAPNPIYNAENFTYCKEEDHYICPQGNIMTTNGRWHQAVRYRFKCYVTNACKQCSVKKECSNAKYGKVIQRSEFVDFIRENKKRIESNKEIYRLRQQIVEHPFGTIKRQWGFDHIMTKKTKKHASADVGLIMTAYNLRRIINIIGFKALIQYFRVKMLSFFQKIGLYELKRNDIKVFILKNLNLLHYIINPVKLVNLNLF